MRLKNVLLIAAIMLAMFTAAWADIVNVGTGTSTNANIPITSYYGYTYSQQLYTPAQITMGGTINKISFFFASGGNTNSTAWVVYMGNTSKTQFSSTTDWVPLAQLTQVFAGNVTIPASNAWMEITLNTPFDYNGTDNLVIAVDENTPNYALSNGMWGVFTSTANTAIYYRSDGTNPDPTTPPTASGRISSVNRLILDITPSGGGGVANPTGFTATPASYSQINLGWTKNGNDNNVMVAVNATNTFGDPREGSEYFVDDTLDGGGLIIYNGSGTSFNHTPLLPNTQYFYKAWSVDGTNVYSTGVTANATTPLAPIDEFPFVETYETDSPTLAGWTVLAGSGTWSISTAAGGYGNSSRSAFANFYSISGTTPFHLFSPVLDTSALPGAQLKFDFAYATYQTEVDRLEVYTSIDDGATYQLLQGMDGGPSGPLATAAPTSSNFVPSAGQWNTITLPLPNGVDKVRFTAISAWGNNLYIDNVTIEEPPANPIFSVSPASKNFGKVEVGDSGSQAFNITNIGGGTLFIDKDDISITGPNADQFSFTPLDNDISLLFGDPAVPIMVFFTPTAEGPASATLSIIDNTTGKASQSIALTGEGAVFNTVPFIDGFEDGIGKWTIVNDTQVNAWYHGTTTAATGDYSVFISNDAGASNAYTINIGSVVHLYQDFNFPAGDDDFTLKFDWKGYGEASWDFIKVYLVNTSTTPVAGNQMATGQLGGEFNIQTDWQTATIALPEGLAGTKKRLIFSWRNDTSVGTMPAGAIDNVRLLAGDDNDAAIIVDGEVTITPPPVLDDYNNPIEPEVVITGLAQPGVVTVTTTYAPPSTVPNAGLALTFSGTTFAGAIITIDHNLGFVPSQIAYRIVPGGWILLTASSPNVLVWNETTISFTVDAKADDDLEVIFPQEEGQTLPVTLSSFTAVLTSDLLVKLAWTAESEVDHSGYNVLRSEVRDLATAAYLNQNLITTEQGVANGSQINYSFTDSEIYNNTAYYYWLESVSINGVSQYAGPVTVIVGQPGEDPEMPTIPVVTKLLNAYPNPFNPQTNIRYSLKEAAKVRIEVYNVRGQKIRSFENNHASPGFYSIVWDGKDDSGNSVGSGIYFYRMDSGRYSKTRKMMMMK